MVSKRKVGKFILKIGSVIFNINDIDQGNILLEERSCENILIYEVAYKTPYGAKLLCINFDKVDRYTRKYSGTKNV